MSSPDVLVPTCDRRPAALAVMLPARHCGEDMLAQQRVKARYGGCAILPSGAYHMALPTKVAARAIDAPYVLPLGTEAASKPDLQPDTGVVSPP
jgi:hypothetical protein